MYKILAGNNESLIKSHDSKGVILAVNAAVAQRYGFTPNALVGNNLANLLADDARSHFEPYINSIVNDKFSIGIFVLQNPEGERIIWLYRNILVQDGDEEPVADCYCMSITQRMDFEKQLQSVSKINDLNILRLHKALADLRRTKENLEKSSRVKDEFLANMSHEIRTPMNAIIGFTNLIENTTLSKEQAEYVGIIKRSGSNLLVIINDILDFSKIESGKLNFEKVPFSLKTELGVLHNTFEPYIQEKGLQAIFEIEPGTPVDVIGDVVRFNQIVTNLVGNAIKFTEFGQITVNVRVIDTAANLATIEVSVNDTGIGIDADKLNLVFESFTQATSSTTRKFGGTGLGLTISRKLVEMQGGRIWVTSTIGRGSKFAFTMPFVLQQTTPDAANGTPGNSSSNQQLDLSGYRVLVAEDNVLNQKLIQRVLQNSGAEMTLVSNGILAVDAIKNQPFDVILMDIQMPDMDGYEATQVIRKEMELDTPIIALTAHAISTERVKCLEMGMNDYISKPFKAQELVNVILGCSVPSGGTQAQPEPLVMPNPAGNQTAVNIRKRLLEQLSEILNQTAVNVKKGETEGFAYIIQVLKNQFALLNLGEYNKLLAEMENVKEVNRTYEILTLLQAGVETSLVSLLSEKPAIGSQARVIA